MSKKKDKAESPLTPEVSRELDKIKLGKEATEKIRKENRPKEEKVLEQLQRARVKSVEQKVLKDEDFSKQKKADRKIGGVRGKFRPSLERTRKRT